MSADPNLTHEGWFDRHVGWWESGKKAERDKLSGHIEVLRSRVRRHLNAPEEQRDLSMPVLLARELLKDDATWRGGDEQAHVHADKLEELLPLIAGSDEVDAMFSLELKRSHDGFALTDVVDALMLASLATDGTTARKGLVLSNLYGVRAERLRHERLMRKHRLRYLLLLAVIILITLVTAGLAIWCGTTAATSAGRGMPLGAELVAAVALGGLGGALGSTFKIREVAELNTFRVTIAYALMQPIVGAAFGFVSLVLLLSEIVSFNPSAQAWASAAVVAFVAGLSEPFALGILDSAMGSMRRGNAT